MLTKKPQKTRMDFYCKKCEFLSSNKKDFTRHINTIKHNANEMLSKKPQKTPYQCSCGKSYKHYSSLIRHKTQCKTKQCINENLSVETISANKVELLEKQLESMTTLIKELVNKVGTQNTIVGNNNNLNINNNEIKIYLTETCANAISIQEFAKQLAITFDDLNMAKDNTVIGLTRIVEKNLEPLSFTERPMHWLKENQWYIKDHQQGWNEDDGDKVIQEAHKKMQKQCLISVCQDDTTNIDLNDDAIQLINFGTSDLKEHETKEIKKKLAAVCLLK